MIGAIAVVSMSEDSLNRSCESLAFSKSFEFILAAVVVDEDDAEDGC